MQVSEMFSIVFYTRYGGRIIMIVYFSGNIYEARRRLIGSREKAIVADVPKTYLTPGPVPTFLKSFSGIESNSSPVSTYE